jgi:hypothetical protein
LASPGSAGGALTYCAKRQGCPIPMHQDRITQTKEELLLRLRQCHTTAG